MRSHSSLRWTVIGDGPLREALTADPRVRALAGRLAFVGSLDHQVTLELLQTADLFVLPCERDDLGRSDGIPVALMEAMALGVPVVTCLVGGVADLVEHDETGVLVPQRDPGALAEAVEQVLYGTSGHDLDRIRHAGRQRVERDFDRVGEARALIDLLRPHLDARSPPGSRRTDSVNAPEGQ